MHIYSLNHKDPIPLTGASIALGNFDGLHKGHCKVIDMAGATAKRMNAPLGVGLFDPAPRRFFQPEAPPFTLMANDIRNAKLAQLGVDVVYELPFNAEMAGKTDYEFSHDILYKSLGVRAVTTGFDFLFGRGRMGNPETLNAHGQTFGFETHITPRFNMGTEKASSTRIRQYLQAGDIVTATNFLGDYWRVSGQVVSGEKRGTGLGFPTANTYLGEQIHPAFAIYAVKVKIVGEDIWRSGVANFGRTPTTGLRDPLLETFIFDFDGDIYGKILHIAFIDRLRFEEKFDSIEALCTQMDKDCAEAKEILSGVKIL